MQNTRVDRAFTTTLQKELFDRRIAYPRGRAIGDTSILNYMVYVRGLDDHSIRDAHDGERRYQRHYHHDRRKSADLIKQRA
jgi:choline dehydrogenase-like flavoprotein